jgi:hypothetical protein
MPKHCKVAIQTLFLAAANWGHSLDCKARSCHAGRRAYSPPLEAWNEISLLKGHRVFLAGQESKRWHTRTEPSFGAGLYCQVLVTGNGGLRRSGVPHNSLHFPAESPAFIGYFLAGFVLKARYDFGEFERSKQTVIVFKVNDDVIVRG